jgi:hypothetical protein
MYVRISSPPRWCKQKKGSNCRLKKTTGSQTQELTILCPISHRRVFVPNGSSNIHDVELECGVYGVAHARREVT